MGNCPERAERQIYTLISAGNWPALKGGPAQRTFAACGSEIKEGCAAANRLEKG